MSQIAEQKIKSRSVTIFLKKENVGNEEDSVRLIEGIKESQTYKLNGKVVNPKKISFSKLIQTDVSGINGRHRYSEAFSQIFTVNTHPDAYKYDSGDIYKVIDDAYGDAQKELGETHGTKMRKATIGDIIQVQEWGYDGVQVGRIRNFMVSKVDFDEFDVAEGEFL